MDALLLRQALASTFAANCEKFSTRPPRTLQSTPAAPNFRPETSRFGVSAGGESVASASMHLRAPSIDQGVQAFLWAVVFFVLLWLGMLAVGVSGATALILSLVSAAAIFLFIRLRGEDRPGPR